jgi:hypothetical protein
VSPPTLHALTSIVARSRVAKSMVPAPVVFVPMAEADVPLPDVKWAPKAPVAFAEV